MAYTNFVYDSERHTVTQIGTDTLFSGQSWWITDTRIGSKRTKAYEQLVKFMTDNSSDMFETFLTSIVRCTNALVAVTGRDNYLTLYKRASALVRDWETAHDTWGAERVPPPPTPPPPTPPSPVVGPRKRKAEPANWTSEKKRELVRDPTVPLVRQQALPAPVVVPPVVPLVRQQALPDPDCDEWGFSYVDRISDFRNAIRVGDKMQAISSFFVCYNATHSNVRETAVNELTVAALKDIGVANHRLVANVVSFTCRWFGEVTPHSANTFIALIVTMCESEKTRIQSHLSHVYSVKNFQESAIKHKIDWCTSPMRITDKNFIRVVEGDHDVAWKMFSHMLMPHFKTTWSRFTSVKDKRDVMRYAFTLVHYVEIGTIKHYNRDSVMCTMARGEACAPYETASTCATCVAPNARHPGRPPTFVSNESYTFYVPTFQKIYNKE